MVVCIPGFIYGGLTVYRVRNFKLVLVAGFFEVFDAGLPGVRALAGREKG